MKSNVKLRYDSRDAHAHIFGQAAEFPDYSNFGFKLTEDIEGAGEVNCTAHATTKAVSSQTKVRYSVEDLWARVPNSAQGADPHDTLGVVKKYGLFPYGGGERYMGIKGYFRGDTGSMDAFDNTRSAMQNAHSSIMCCTVWYQEWENTAPNTILPLGLTPVSNHAYELLDWTVINNQSVFIVDAHEGFLRYMPREVFNKALSVYGTATYMPSTHAILDKQVKTLMQKVQDFVINVWIAIRDLRMQLNG